MKSLEQSHKWKTTEADCSFASMSIELDDDGAAGDEHVLLAALAVNYGAPLSLLNEIAKGLRRPCTFTIDPSATSQLIAAPLTEAP